MFEVSSSNKTTSKSSVNNNGKVVQRKADASNPLAKIISNSDITSRIQTKLNVGKSGDEYEREADKAAEQVTAKPTEVVQPSIQLKVEHGSLNKQEEEKEEVQTKSQSEEEREEEPVQKQSEDKEEEPLQTKGESEEEREEPLQKQDEEGVEEEEEPAQLKSEESSSQEDEELQGKEAKRGSVDSEFEQKLNAQKGKGSPLPDETKEFMEPRLKADFGNVRVHSGSSAVEMNKQMKSQAFTVGSDLFFNEGKYKPDSTEGKKLLTHELTHVIQQGKAKRKKTESVSTKPENETGEKPTTTTSTSEKTSKTSETTQQTSVTTETASAATTPAADTGVTDKTTSAKESASKEKPGETGSAGKTGTGKETPSKQEDVPASPPAEGEGKALETKAAGGKEEAAKVEAVALEGKSEDVLNKLKKPSEIAATFPAVGGAVTNKLDREQKATAESVPPLKAQTGGVKETPEQEGKEPDKESADIDKGVTEPEPPKPEVKEQEHAGEPPSNKKIDKQLDKVEEGGFFSWFRDSFNSIIGGVSTEDPGVNTSAGERPDMNLSGEADPSRVDSQKSEGKNKADEKKTETVDAIKNNPGKENIQPVKVDEEQKLAIKEKAEVSVETSEDKGMKEYAELPYPADMREAADNKLKPMTEKSLTKQREEVTAAASKRDQDKTAEMKRAEDETAKLNADAEKEQNDIVDKSRTDVDTKQKEGMKEAEDKLGEFEQEAAEEETSQNEKIKKRVEDDKKEADKKLSDAEKEAQKEKEKGEKEAREKKKELEKDSENDSWWDRAVNAVKSAVKAITDAIDKVFDAVRKAVKTIIDAAKNAALAVIEAGRKWVVEQLDNFGKWIKDKVNTYIGSIFPGIAKKINAAIDATVNKAKEAVNFVADKLKKGVEALANAVTNAINNILNKFQTAMKAAVQIAGALLTGDFAEALKIAFFAACEIAGIDPKPILDFLNYAGETITIIYKDPLKFFMNVVNGVKKGLNQFVGNIKKHLLNGLIGWLTGAISEAGITLPEKFDLKGIFSLVMQILGLTYQNIRAKVVKKLGPKGEQIVSTLETAVSFVKDLVTKGPIVLWDKVKEKLTDLKETVIGGIRDWVITTVIKEGVLWIISLLNPASAIAKALKLLYDFVMFLVERYQQIIDFVKSVFESVGAIARGSLGKAANAVEGALGKSVPVIISFMASLLGLGGISKTIKNIIAKVRKPIDNALDKIIGWLVKKGKALLKKGKSALKKGKEKVMGWLGLKKKFTTAQGKSHTMLIKGKTKPKIVVRSEERDLRWYGEVLSDLRTLPKEYDDQKEALKKISGRKTNGKRIIEIADEFYDIVKNKADTIPESKVNSLLSEATILIPGELLDAEEKQLPLTKVTWQKSGGYAFRVDANPLTKRQGNTQGKMTGGQHIISTFPFMKWLNENKQVFVQTHLLSHRLHGPAADWNLAGTHERTNLDDLEPFERTMVNIRDGKQAVEGDSSAKALNWRTQLAYPSGSKSYYELINAEDTSLASKMPPKFKSVSKDDFPSHINITVKWKKDNEEKDIDPKLDKTTKVPEKDDVKARLNLITGKLTIFNLNRRDVGSLVGKITGQRIMNFLVADENKGKNIDLKNMKEYYQSKADKPQYPFSESSDRAVRSEANANNAASDYSALMSIKSFNGQTVEIPDKIP